MARYPATGEPPEDPPPAADPAVTVAAESTATMEPFDAPQAPASGRTMGTESPSGRTEAMFASEAEFDAPQAPGPAGDNAAP